LNFGFDWLRLSTIWAHTQKANAANIRLNTKLGFQIESELECAGVAFLRMSLSLDRFRTATL
jgi:RimJ/RimL family protein N-acetyltransferase